MNNKAAASSPGMLQGLKFTYSILTRAWQPLLMQPDAYQPVAHVAHTGF